MGGIGSDKLHPHKRVVGAYLSPIVPVHFVAVIFLGVVGCSDLDTCQTLVHLDGIGLEQKKFN